MKLLLVLLLFTFSLSTQALVDMKNANFIDYWVDMVVPGKKSELSLTRTYSSRSLYTGLFGFGWCSEVESRLEFTKEGNLRLHECHKKARDYEPSSQNVKFLKVHVKKLISLLKKKPKLFRKYNVKNLNDSLMKDASLRTKLATLAGYKWPPTPGLIYLHNNLYNDRIVFDGSSFVWNRKKRHKGTFNQSGLLTQLVTNEKQHIYLVHGKSKIKSVSNKEGKKISFFYDNNGRLSQVRGENRLTAVYTFSTSDLIRVKNAWGNQYTYHYDSLHNLTHIEYPDKKSRKISYNEKRDWVVAYEDRETCKEVFKFILSKHDPQNNYTSSSKKTCGRKLVSKNKFEFWYKDSLNRTKFLSRIRNENGSRFFDISYDPKSSQPTKIERNNERFIIKYNSLGLRSSTLETRPSSPFYKKQFTEYFYNKSFFLTQAKTTNYASMNKASSEILTKYSYSSGQLIGASNSKGQSVTISYNKSGLINKLKDKSQKSLSIYYDSKKRRPVRVKSKGGVLIISYNQRDEIDSVSSKPKGMSRQIASLLTNFSETIGPAYRELELALP